MRSRGNESVFAVRLTRQQRARLIQKARDWRVSPSWMVRFSLSLLLAEQPRPEQAQGEK